MELKQEKLKAFLDEKVQQYNHPSFIEKDPISVPHAFTVKQDIEIAGFFAATIAWGNRKNIMINATKLMECMDYAPYDFIINHTKADLDVFNGFVHRTFQETDVKYFAQRLQQIYKEFESLEKVFIPNENAVHMHDVLVDFHKLFFAIPHPKRTVKHVANPAKKSAAKRMHMFLRWMVRNDTAGVDLGIWENISPRFLSCPLDVHSGNVARALGLLKRKQNDLAAVQELDVILRTLDPNDPVKYDFALFGLGVFEGF